MKGENMIRIIKLSSNAKDYISKYFEILNKMEEDMQNVELENNIARHFIFTMIAHHNGGLLMADNVLKFTTNPDIEELATSLVESSSKGIDKLSPMLDTCTEENDKRDLLLYQRGYNDIFGRMIATLETTQASNNVNADFLSQMIAHHQSGVAFMLNLLRFDICDSLREEVSNSIQQHNREIQEMQELQKQIKRLL